MSASPTNPASADPIEQIYKMEEAIEDLASRCDGGHAALLRFVAAGIAGMSSPGESPRVDSVGMLVRWMAFDHKRRLDRFVDQVVKEPSAARRRKALQRLADKAKMTDEEADTLIDVLENGVFADEW